MFQLVKISIVHLLVSIQYSYDAPGDKLNVVEAYGLNPETVYIEEYGIYWSNSSGESNRVKVSFTTTSDTTTSDTTTE